MNQKPQSNHRQRTNSEQSIPSLQNIEMIKKSILQDAQYFNIGESYNHKKNRLMERQKQLETYSQLNRRLQTEILTQKQKQRRRKEALQQQLKEEYEKQMRQHQNRKRSVKEHQKVFAKQLESYHEHYHNRRMNDIARMYNPRAYQVGQSENGDSRSRIQTEQIIRDSGGTRNPYLRYPSEQIENRIGNLYPNYGTVQPQVPIANNINYKPSFNPFNPIADQRRSQVKPQSYQQYLKKEIQRKQLNKIKERQQKLVKEHQQATKNQIVYKDSLDEFKIMQRKQREQFRRGLEQQITQKRSKRNYF